MTDPKKILEYYKKQDLPVEQHTGIIVAIDSDNLDETYSDIIIPKDIDKISSRNNDIVTGVILNTPKNSEYPELMEGKRIMFKPTDGARVKINGHCFHIIDEPYILAILDD